MTAGLTAAEVARVTGGTLRAPAETPVAGPAVIDSREVTPGALFAALPGEHADGHDFVERALAEGAALALTSRQVPGPSVVVEDVPAALAALARHHLVQLRHAGALTVVAVTGSHGKTSVKDLLARMLATTGSTVASHGSFNNELGVPLTVLRADASTRFLVVEMGARGLGHIAYLCRIAPPDIAMVLNVGSAHRGEFGSAEVTARAKGEIVEALAPDGVAVLNADDPRVAAMAERTVAAVVTFGYAGSGVRLAGEIAIDEQGHPHVPVEIGGQPHDLTVAQIGPHQVLNAAAALAAAQAAGVAPGVALAAVADAGPGSPMRMQRLRRDDGLTVINDAYNANPESMEAALRALVSLAEPARCVAVLGTMRELGDSSERDHEALGALAADLGIGRVVAVGPEAAAIARGAGAVGEVAATADVAVRTLVSSLRPEHVVLVKASRGERLERIVDGLLADAR